VAEETNNLGWLDAQTYASNPGTSDAPQVGHQEYERGSLAYALARIGAMIAESASDPANYDPITKAGLYEDVGEPDWSAVLTNSGPNIITAITYLGNGVVLAGGGSSTGDGLVWRSTDSGATWGSITVDATLESCYDFVNLGDGVVLAGFGTNNGDADIWKSTDSGATWGSQVYTDANANTVRGLAYLGNSDVVAVRGGNAGEGEAMALKSSDDGATWADRAFTEDIAHCVAYCGDDVVVVGTGGTGNDQPKIYRSTDRGDTFDSGSYLNPNDDSDADVIIDDVLCLEYIGSSVLLAGTGSTEAGDGDVYRSSDKGVTWTKISFGSEIESVNSLCHLGGLVVLAGVGKTANSDAKVFKSVDGGLTFTQIETIEGTDEATVRSLCYLGNGLLLAGISSSAGTGEDIFRSKLISITGA
jgi:photosystem II stability/assembly factor-like uncharacterized protein